MLAHHGHQQTARSQSLLERREVARQIEGADPQGHKHPRFKKSDDATAVLLRLV